MKNMRHLSQGEMVQSIDGEFASSEQAEVEIHLANCEECLNRYEALVELSEALRHVVEKTSVSTPIQARVRLAASLGEPSDAARARPRVLWKWAAAAAGLAIVLLLIVQQRPRAVQEIAARKTEAPSAPREPEVTAHALPSRTWDARSPRRRAPQKVQR
ncbi:MAG: zf-HC2 domain-containing protein, partial [Bryobacteraceae bacterium]